jgi:hypothetical protein
MTSKINHNLEIGEDGTEYSLKLNGQEVATRTETDLSDLIARVQALEAKTEKIECNESTTINGDLNVGSGGDTPTTHHIYLNGSEFTGTIGSSTLITVGPFAISADGNTLRISNSNVHGQTIPDQF